MEGKCRTLSLIHILNAAVRLYADAANAKTKMENGFDLTNYDERTLAFAKDYANQLLAILSLIHI